MEEIQYVSFLVCDYINPRLIGGGLTLQRGPGGNRAHASIVMTSEVNKRSGTGSIKL